VTTDLARVRLVVRPSGSNSQRNKLLNIGSLCGRKLIEGLYIPKLLALRLVQAYHRQGLVNYNYDFHHLKWSKSAGILYILLKPATSHYIMAQKTHFYVNIRANINYNVIFDRSDVTIDTVANNLLQL